MKFFAGRIPAGFEILLIWLLQLVPEDFKTLINGPKNNELCPPFHVIGVQQMLVDDELNLNIAVVPNTLFESKDVMNRIGKVKNLE